jgi:hypothetical protein
MINNFLRITPITKDCRVEFDYLYVWNEPYEIVDATFLVFGFDKKSTIKNLTLFIYKLWYINPEASRNEIIEYVVGLLNMKSSSGIFVTETDIVNLVFNIFNVDLPNDISSMVKTKDGVKKTTKIVEWKHSLNGLLVIDSKTMNQIRLSSDINEELKKEYKRIKIKYMKQCLDKVKKTNSIHIVENTIDVLREDRDSATVKDISDISGMSYITTRKYIDLMADRLNFIDGFKVIKNQHKETAEQVLCGLLKNKEEMIRLGVKFNKISLHKISGVSRPTIDKYWDNLNK